MKTPTLLRSITADLERGDAAVVQLVSTGESLMERRLAEIPVEEWADLSIDVTPREYVLDYLAKGFPTQLYERYADEEGNILSRPVVVDGQPVQSREAVEIRDRLIEKLASLPPVQTALDQILHHFGTDQVAEVTGRNRRIVKKVADGQARLAVENRPGSANLAETQSFMDDKKRILVFSDAGGTGRSYHADLSARNQRKRVHYMLEPGWKADTAIQGLGRSNRTNQAQPPLFRPVATNVKGEKRFLSTIAKRLDSLGAITRGQRQTGGQGLFRPEDNLESPYARAALVELYTRIFQGKVAFASLGEFETATGLRLTTHDGSMLEELPPITTFLNRVLALPIALQNRLFELFEELLAVRVEAAIASGTYDIGLETLIAESLVVTDRRVLHTHERTGAVTSLLTIRREDKNEPTSLEAVLALAKSSGSPFLVNTSSGRAALQVPASSLTHEDGSIEERVRLIRPLSRDAVSKTRLAASHWQIATEAEFTALWLKELAEIPPTKSSEFHLVTGLLLPVWKHLPRAASKVYRLQTDRACPGTGQGPYPGRTHRRPPHPDRRRAGSSHRLQSRRRGHALAERCHGHAAGRGKGDFAPGRSGLARLDRHGREAHRADRLFRHRGRAAQELRLLQRDHRLALAAVPAARGAYRRRGPVAPLPALSAALSSALQLPILSK